MKVTLKLTDNECRVVNNKTKHIMFVESCIEDGSGGIIEVLNVDKFREFLNDKSDGKNVELGRITMSDYNNLKSILSKLDKAVVQNNEPKIDKNLLNAMHKNDFRDKLIECGEDEYVDWVEKTAYKNLQIDEPKDDSYVQIKASDLNDICEIAKSLMKFADGDSVTEDRAYNILVKAQQPLQERDPQNI
tara:strand:+ start:139 stop:705 length:567 start_codon:yes stop_codon:yes gene_type:complete